MFRKLLKELAAQQIADKRARKTGSVTDPREWGGWSSVDGRLKESSGRVATARRAAERVDKRRVRITAVLNMYHQARGSSHRHHVREDDRWQYEREVKEVQKMHTPEGECGFVSRLKHEV